MSATTAFILFILPGLICSLVMNARAIHQDVLQNMVQLLYPFLRNEYFLHWDEGEALAKRWMTWLPYWKNASSSAAMATS